MRGRPPKPIAARQVQHLSEMGCTVSEIASVLGCHRDTLYARFSDSLLKRGAAVGKISLRRMQFRKAMRGDVRMLIWLGKQYLNQREPVSARSLSDAELLDAARKLLQSSPP